MKICYIADAASIHIQRWMNYFAQKGHEVHLITLRVGEGYFDGVRLHLLPMPIPRSWPGSGYINALAWRIQTRRLVRKIKPDIINAHSITTHGHLAIASGFHPVVLTAWGSDILIYPKKRRLYKFLVQHALKRAELITCDTEHIQKPLIELAADPQKINLVYHGTNTQKFHPGQKDKRLREELGIFDSPTVISLRRLSPIYDIESLITAVPLVLKEVPEAKFLLVEKGSQEVELKELAKSLGVSDSVKFVGWVPENELPRYLTSADIYVSTSLSDAGLAASTAEAMACGLPVIITDFGDNRKWVQDSVNGYIIPLRSPQALSSKVIHLIRNKDLREKFGQINRKIIEERNNWEVEMGKMGKLYEEVIERCKQ